MGLEPVPRPVAPHEAPLYQAPRDHAPVPMRSFVRASVGLQSACPWPSLARPSAKRSGGTWRPRSRFGPHLVRRPAQATWAGVRRNRCRASKAGNDHALAWPQPARTSNPNPNPDPSRDGQGQAPPRPGGAERKRPSPSALTSGCLLLALRRAPAGGRGDLGHMCWWRKGAASLAGSFTPPEPAETGR